MKPQRSPREGRSAAHRTGARRQTSRRADVKPARPQGPRKGGAPSKREIGQRHQERFRRQQRAGGYQGGRGAQKQAEPQRARQSYRTADVDIHLASKVSHELREHIAQFRAKAGTVDLFGADLNRLFALVPPPFIAQHLPDSVQSFRSYLSRFQRGTANMVACFMTWYEWASYEAYRANPRAGGGKAASRSADALTDAGADAGSEEEEKDDDDDDDDEKGTGRSATGKSATRQALAHTLQERAHVRALLQMCLRSNHVKRRQGQVALIHHLNAKLGADGVDARTLGRLRDTAHHSVTYLIARLLLGMASTDFAMLVLHCHALYLVLTMTAISPGVVLEMVEDELALSTRMRAIRVRLAARQSHGTAAGAPTEDELDLIDPDELNDPTRGERNQRLTAAVFALGAVVAAGRQMSEAEAARTASYLCFCYVEQKATRVVSANVLFRLLVQHPAVWRDAEAMQWTTFAFFFYPKLEYFRPEAVQLLLRLMQLTTDGPAAISGELSPTANSASTTTGAPLTSTLARGLPAAVTAYLSRDPLQPAMLEQMVHALFRKEQVTAVHPMVHPFWDDLFDLVQRRCAMGESLKEHLSTIIHTAIAPYRRGNADLPRRALFQHLVTRLGQLAVQSVDAEQRAEILHIASTNVGYGRRALAKPTTLQELRQLSIEALGHKVDDLLVQYRRSRDGDPGCLAGRTWVLRELRNCLYVPVRPGVDCPYVNEAVTALLEFGFCPRHASRDERSMNRAIYIFADVFSFTFTGPLTRPRCTLPGLQLMQAYLKAEAAQRTRYYTAVNHMAFRKARNRVVEALETSAQRSVLFYDSRDMEILLTLLFLVLSVDDATNNEASTLATSVVPDLVQFFCGGTLETLDIFFDALMALIMRGTAPLQVMPLMTCARRVAVGFVLKFARYICHKQSLDLLLSPLREAFHTDIRELLRQRKMKEGGGEDDDAGSEAEVRGAEETQEVESEASEAAAADADDAMADEEDASSAGAESDATAEGGGDDDDDDTATEVDEEEADRDADSATEQDTQEDEPTAEPDSGSDGEEDEEAADEEAEPATEAYLSALKAMVGDVDLDHRYPTDVANKEKSDVVRAIQLAARVGLALRSSLVVQVLQVLLAVCRESVKDADEMVFGGALSSINMVLLTKNRYYGSFLPAPDLFQLFGDIQSYIRKLDRALVGKEHKTTPKAAALARRRMHRLKVTALRVFHFVAMLAYKNHASDEVRITLMEYYKSIFCDRGWDMAHLLPELKKDLFHYRQGFAWALLPAALDKFDEVASLSGPQRVRVFEGCCALVEAMLPRLSGLPGELRAHASAAIRHFLQSRTLAQVYAMRYTVLHTFLHAVKMVLQYNSRVQLDTAWAAEAVVGPAIDDDAVQLTLASIRTVAAMERLLGLTPRALETKTPVPLKVLHEQFRATLSQAGGASTKEKLRLHQRAKRVRTKIIKALLAHRNDEATDEERARRRRRREELRIEDRLQRQVMRQAAKTPLTKAERIAKRKQILAAKQERIARNRERKRRLHELRQRSFERWREAKLAAASDAVS